MSKINNWSTPKRRFQQMDNDHDEFVALPPQEQTIVGSGEYEDCFAKNIATPIVSSRLPTHSNRIFHSLGNSEKLDSIHKETDYVVKEMIRGNSPRLSKQSDRKNMNLLDRESNMKIHSPHIVYDNPYKLSPSETSQCQELFTAKDEIIQQKDIIMQKQKNIINQLRQRNIDLEEQLIQKEQMQFKATNFQYIHRDHQQQIQKLQQDMDQNHSRKCVEIEKLQRKLGEREYEIGKLQIALKEHNLTKENKIEKVLKEFEQNNQKMIVEKEKFDKLKIGMTNLRQENRKLQAYLEEVPTSEEFKKLKSQLKEASHNNEDLKEKQEMQQKRYNDIKKEYIEKENECKKLQKLSLELKEDLSCMNTTLNKYRSKDPVSIEHHERKLQEISQLQIENKDLRESLSKRQKKLSKLHYDTVAKYKEMDDEKKSLMETIKSINEQIEEQNISITKLNARNQELLSSSLEYQSQLKEYKERYNEEYEMILKTLFTEMVACMDEMKSFVALCTSISKGGEPSLEALLGFKDQSPTTPGSVAMVTMNLNDLNEKHELLKETRKEIEKLRRLVSEKYAEEIGQNMCITQ